MARNPGPALLSVPTDVDLVVAVLLDRADADAKAAKETGAPRSAAAGVNKLRALAGQLEPYGSAPALDLPDEPAVSLAAVEPERDAYAS